MIKLYDRWVIDADSNCYILGKLKKSKNKYGEMIETIESPTYHATIEQALNALMRKQQRDHVKNNMLTLGETLREFESIHKTLAEKLSEVENL